MTPLHRIVAVLAFAVGVVACTEPPPAASEAPPPAVSTFVAPAPNDRDEVQLDGGPWVLAVHARAGGYQRLPLAQPGDWRDGPGSDELPQDLAEYRASFPPRATATRTTIVLQPLGPIDAPSEATFARLRELAAAYFAVPVEVAPPRSLPERGRRERREGAKTWTQHHAGYILDALKPRLPPHAICYVGITLEDLYPEPQWNYVFGLASLQKRVGVYSLARYQPAFWDAPDSPAARRLALLRAYKVLTHETGHMFGLPHCVHFSCGMNGSNTLDETDRQPLWLCPVCASKLTWNRDSDPLVSYRRLAALLREDGLDEEAAWYEARVAALAR